MTMRDQSSGKKHGNVNAKTMCKLDHLKSIAVWAPAEASVPSLGAFLGERLAATTEALGLRADPSLFFCERCESTLQPGSNCTVRIEKNKSKARRHKSKKSNLNTQNNVVYTCHFCSHRNLMRGTPKGYVNKLCPPKAKPPLTAKSVDKCPISTKATMNIADVNKTDAIALSTGDGLKKLETSSPATPLPTSGLSILDSKMRKRNRSNARKVAEPETSLTEGDDEKSKQGASKRRRKAWTSLKEIAQSGGNDSSKKLTSLSIPF
ncbi:hypothetical protein PHJA_002074800 [Phtheirospermum japonicum]|uniref:Uncharacterized protein n=1 Tax=Phtheirospermum japonicum TaxID=374723 RepID=A0A830CEX8_9LAMI|nr:hypothetical protein PHJA_002074800 [Phtheirospermum japonicum]